MHELKMSFRKPALAPAAPRGAAGQGIFFLFSAIFFDYKKDSYGMTG